MPVTDTKAAARGIVKRAIRLPLAHKLRLVARLASDRRVPWIARIPLVLLLLYLAMPLDIIPDFIPVIGQLDDLLVAVIAVWWFVRTCPPSIALEHLESLEGVPLTRFDRLLPWLLGGAMLVALVAVSVYCFIQFRRTSAWM